MELKQNPFSLYDFLGYFTPGAIFIYSFMALLAHAGELNGDIIEALSFEKRQLYVPFVLASYTTGHLLSFISSVFIEKYTVWTIGYPSKYLLGFKPDKYFSINCFVRLIVGLLLTPISLTEFILNLTLKYRATYAHALDDLLIATIKVKMDSLILDKSGLSKYPENTHSSRSDFFRFAYHFAVETAPNHFPKMQNYVAIYGFLRTMTMITVFFFWAALLHVSATSLSYHVLIIIFISLSILSFTFYMSFVKFWRRFTLEAMMAIAVTYEVKEKVDPNNYLKNEAKKSDSP
ncbi:MAG: hypothetical protein WAX04_08800 [Oscillospiraceae bacterium]